MKTELYLGLDVHNEWILVAVAASGRNGAVQDLGAISNDLHALEKLLARLCKRYGRESFLSVADHFTTDRATVDAGEALFHGRGEQRNMRNFAQMLGDEPDWFFRSHPVKMIESGEIYRTRIAAQRPFAAEVKIDVEVTHRQLAQAAVNRLAVTAAGEIGFRHCPPVPADLENRDNVVGVLFRFQIEDQWRKSENAQSGSAKDSTLKT